MNKTPLTLITSFLLASTLLNADVVFQDDFANMDNWTLSGNTDPVASGGNAVLVTSSHSAGTYRSIMTTATSYEGFNFGTCPSVSMTLTDVDFSLTSGEAPMVLQVGYTPDPTSSPNGLPVLNDAIYYQQIDAGRAYLYLREGGVQTQLATLSTAGLSLSYDSIVMELSPVGWSITLTAAGGGSGTPQTGTFSGGAPSWVGDLYAQVVYQQGSAGAGPHSSELTIGAFEVTNIPEASSQGVLVGIASLLIILGIRRKSRHA